MTLSIPENLDLSDGCELTDVNRNLNSNVSQQSFPVSNKDNVDGYADGEVPTHGQTVTRSNLKNVLNSDG